MHRYYSLQKDPWFATVTLDIKNDTVDCSVRVDFERPNTVDFNSVLRYHLSYPSVVSCIAHSNMFEVSVRVDINELDRLTSSLSHALEPLGCYKERLLNWVRDEITQIRLAKSHASNPHGLMAASKVAATERVSPGLVSKL